MSGAVLCSAKLQSEALCCFCLCSVLVCAMHSTAYHDLTICTHVAAKGCRMLQCLLKNPSVTGYTCSQLCVDLATTTSSGKWNDADLLFLPMIPPSMHKGMVTSAQMTRMITMVPKGKACVDCSNKGTSAECVCRNYCFFHIICPSMHKGMVTSPQTTRTITIVPKGRACVNCSNKHNHVSLYVAVAH